MQRAVFCRFDKKVYHIVYQHFDAAFAFAGWDMSTWSLENWLAILWFICSLASVNDFITSYLFREEIARLKKELKEHIDKAKEEVLESQEEIKEGQDEIKESLERIEDKIDDSMLKWTVVD